jgi:hypothetical protein
VKTDRLEKSVAKVNSCSAWRRVSPLFENAMSRASG